MTRALESVNYGVMGSWTDHFLVARMSQIQGSWGSLLLKDLQMVVGLLSPQLSNFSCTETVFDSPTLPNNCHKRLIIHYCLFFYKHFKSY